MKIELINAKWCINGKDFSELTPAERELLNQFFKILKQQYES